MEATRRRDKIIVGTALVVSLLIMGICLINIIRMAQVSNKEHSGTPVVNTVENDGLIILKPEV